MDITVIKKPLPAKCIRILINSSSTLQKHADVLMQQYEGSRGDSTIKAIHSEKLKHNISTELMNGKD